MRQFPNESSRNVFYDNDSIQSFSSVRVNADNSNKKAVFAFWIVFAFFEVIVLVTSNFTPYAFEFKTNESALSKTKYQGCSNPMTFDEKGRLSCQQFALNNPKIGLIMRDLSSLNQFAQINLLFFPKNKNSTIIQINQEFQVQLMSLKRRQEQLDANTQVNVFEKGEDVRRIQSVAFNSKQYELSSIKWSKDSSRWGYEVNLGYYRQFKSEDGLMIITFIKLAQETIENFDIEPQAIIMNRNYTIFIIILRAIFLGIMTLTLVLFWKKIRQQLLILIQQKIVLVLSFFVILFNDPYYFIGVFKPSIFSIFISTTFLCSFFIVMTLSWVSILQKIKLTSQGHQFTFNFKRKLVYGSVASVYFCLVFYLIFEIGYYSYTESPIIPLHSAFQNLYLIIVVFFALILGYISWLYICIFLNWNKVIWRDKIYTTFNIFFILLNLVFIFLGWFSFYDESSQKFQIFYASTNFYVLYLQYMYLTPLVLVDKQDPNSHQQLNQVSQNHEISVQMGEECITIDLQGQKAVDLQQEIKEL